MADGNKGFGSNTSPTSRTGQSLISGASGQANGGQFNPYLGNTPYAADPKGVYMGGQNRPGIGYGTFGGFGAKSNAGKGGSVPYAEAVLAPTQWSESKLSQFVNQGIINKVPGFEPGMGMPQIQAAWQNMVQASMLYNSNSKPGQKQWSPWDVLGSWSDNKGKFGTKRDGDWLYDVATGERIKYVGPRSKTITSKKVDLSSAADVKALATQALRELLGRAPTAEEFAKFRGAINSEEKSNPLVTKTTQQLSPDLASGRVDVTSESSTTSGGVSDAARAALIQAPTVKTKEYGKFQSGTTYWDAMMQMISGGG